MAKSKIVGSDRVTIWVQENGLNTSFIPFAVGEKAMSMTGISITGTTQTPMYSTDAYGRPLLVKKNLEAPGSLPGATLSIYEQGQVDLLRQRVEDGCPINVQSRINLCGNLINPDSWQTLDYYSGGIVESLTIGDVSLEYSGESLISEATVTFDSVIRIVQLSLVSFTTTETENLLAIAGIPDVVCGGCNQGAYKGANQHLFAGASAVALGNANVWFSNTGGGSWTEITAKPFAVDEDISEISASLIGSGNIRIVVATDTTDAGVGAKFAYADVTIGDEANAVWTEVVLASSALGDVITAMDAISYDRGYLSANGDIFVSSDAFVSDPGAAIYAGTEILNGFAGSPDGSMVWGFGATNTILLESDADDTFVSKVGPTAGGDFTALTVANDGLIYAGNGSSIFLSVDEAGVAGNWTELKDFGTNMEVFAIECVQGESQLLRVFVNDSVGAVGSVWQSVDGGASFTQYTALANAGYNGCYYSDSDANLSIVIGNTYSGLGLVQGLRK